MRKRKHISGNPLARLDANATASAIREIPRLLYQVTEVGVDAAALMLARGGQHDFAIHFGDEVELRDPRIITHIAKTAAQGLANGVPHLRDAIILRAIGNGSADGRRLLRAHRSTCACRRITGCGLFADHGPSSTLLDDALPDYFFGQKVSPTTQAPEPQIVSERRKVTRYKSEFFSVQRSRSTATNAAAEELFL